MVVQAALPPAMTIQDIAEATSGDPGLSELRKRITLGGKLPKELASYQHMLHELSVTREGVVLRDTRIVIP